MRIYESNIRLDECIQLMKDAIPGQEGDIEFSVQKNRVEISIKRTFKFRLSRRNMLNIPVIFYGKLSQSGTHTILAGSFEIASAWKTLCTIFSFAALLSAGVLLGHIVFGQIPFADNAKSELLSYYGFALLFFLTIPLIKYTGRNDENSMVSFLERELKFRLKREIIQFSQSDKTSISALLIAHISGFVWAMFF